MAWGAQLWGPLPLPVLPLCPPSHPFHHRGRGGDIVPPPKHLPLPLAPLLPSAPGPSGWGVPSATPMPTPSSATPNPPHTCLGGTGNQVLLVKLGPPVRAPPPSTAWAGGAGLLSPEFEPPPHWELAGAGLLSPKAGMALRCQWDVLVVPSGDTQGVLCPRDTSYAAHM